jgi:hypothetical protein
MTARRLLSVGLADQFAVDVQLRPARRAVAFGDIWFAGRFELEA